MSLYFTTHFAEITDTSFTESNSFGTLDGETTIVGSPSANQRITIKDITIHNPESLDISVKVYIDDNSNTRTICFTTLASKESMIIDDVIVLDATTESVKAIIEATLPRGFFGGGFTTSGVSDTIEQLLYSTDTTSVVATAGLSQARLASATTNNHGISGYLSGGDFSGGGDETTRTDKLIYSIDTCSAKTSANISTATSSCCGVNSANTNGYIAGGVTGASIRVATAYKLVFSTDTTAAQSSANLSQARFDLAGASNVNTAGYFVGGSTGANVATADKLTYSSDTTAAQSSANLSQARHSLAGVSDTSIAGYFAGGSTGATVVTADKLVFSNDTTAAQSSANLSQARYGLTGASNNGTAGYFAGGSSSGSAVQVTADKLVYATDTTAAQSSANLTVAKYYLGGLDG